MTSTILEPTPIETTTAGFAALADPIRLRILALLAGGSRCVCEIIGSVAVAPNLLSYHLRVLREAGLVHASRRGRWVDYSLDDDALRQLRAAVPAP